MKSRILIDKFIKEINYKALEEQGKSKDDVSLLVSEKIYNDMKPFLKDGCYKGIKLYC
jgi:hypothetical protein